jgi:mannose/fructose/N-acetylgalactosamine-specific phosphotransferase system component IIC
MLYFIIGYVAAVVFPIPWLSAGIIGLWGRALTAFETWFKGVVPPSL